MREGVGVGGGIGRVNGMAAGVGLFWVQLQVFFECRCRCFFRCRCRCRCSGDRWFDMEVGYGTA